MTKEYESIQLEDHPYIVIEKLANELSDAAQSITGSHTEDWHERCRQGALKMRNLLKQIDQVLTQDAEFMAQVMCGRCYDDVRSEANLYEAKCAEKPERLLGMPIGMYHCPDCGAMVLAGNTHPMLCGLCVAGRHIEYDTWDQCELTPPGWWCSIDKGHEGPCAARKL